MTRRKTKVLQVRPAGPDHQVVTITSTKATYRRTPCPGCPWVKENAGSFPAEAFRHSSRTAYDMAQEAFSCHESGSKNPATCAGFLLHGAMHNMAVRLGYLSGKYKDDVSDGGREMFESYRAMAEANGVDPEDPVLAPCR